MRQIYKNIVGIDSIPIINNLFICEIEQLVACRAHNPKVKGSNPFFTKLRIND